MEWERLVGKQGEEYSTNLADTLRILKVGIKIFKAHNIRMIEAHKILSKTQEKQA